MFFESSAPKKKPRNVGNCIGESSRDRGDRTLAMRTASARGSKGRCLGGLRSERVMFSVGFLYSIASLGFQGVLRFSRSLVSRFDPHPHGTHHRCDAEIKFLCSSAFQHLLPQEQIKDLKTEIARHIGCPWQAKDRSRSWVRLNFK